MTENPKLRATRSVRDRKRYKEKREVVLERRRRWREAHAHEIPEINRKQYLKRRERSIARRKLTPRESAIENYLRDKILERNGLCIKFMDPGQRGAPDRLIVLHGRPTYYVEVKRPHLGVLDEAQKRYHQRLRERGQRVWVLWSREDVDAFLVEIELT